MNRHTFTVLSLSAAIVVLAGCNPNPASRYTLNTEQLPNGTITRVFDEKHNTELLHITELSLEPPAITVFPLSRLDVSSVSVGPFGQEEVLIGYSEKAEGNTHSIAVSEPGQAMKSVLWHVDANKDSKVDARRLRFQTETGFIQYFDLDANGILDAQFSMALEGDSAREGYILVKQNWVPIEGDSAAFHDEAPQVTTKVEPQTTYHFQEGSWRKTEAPTTPQ